jgi:hypothetical protein
VSLTAIAFVLAFLAGGTLALVRGPIFGLATYVLALYIHPPSRWWGQGLLEDVRWSLIAAAVALLSLLVHRSKTTVTPVFRSGPFWALTAFVIWVAIQSAWALDGEAHAELLSIYWKFLVVMVLITQGIRSEGDLKVFLWCHVLGCAYLGWIAYTSYSGGRFEGFGGPGIGEANAAAVVLVTGMSVAGGLFLAGTLREKTSVIVAAPLLANAVVATISRSGFLATLVAGIAFSFLAPAKFRKIVAVISLLALLLFSLVTGRSYWERIETIGYRGEEVAGVDTGASRIAILHAQWRMAATRPLGCGHACTTYLSYTYLDTRYHAVEGGRASHNTFMSMLVDHGIPGAALYILMAWWSVSRIHRLRRMQASNHGFLAALVPAVGAGLIAILVGDLFVQYVRFEIRFWLISVLMVMLHLSSAKSTPATEQSANGN